MQTEADKRLKEELKQLQAKAIEGLKKPESPKLNQYTETVERTVYEVIYNNVLGVVCPGCKGVIKNQKVKFCLFCGSRLKKIKTI